ncbi:MAG TPA: flippase [Rhodanobacteraceae bacterium]|nr:flippase [Rhodanobacteraceae bacterium]
MRRLIQTLRDDLQSGTERSRLVRAAVATAAMKVTATGIAFLASLLYARVLGPHDYGLYAYVIAWTAILTIPASLGLPQYLVREGAKLGDRAGRLRRWADVRVLATGVLAGALLACATWLPQAAGARWLFVLAAPIPLLANLSAVRQSLLQARGWIARSQWPQLVFAPMLTLVLLVAWWLWHGSLRASDVVIATVLAALLQLGINVVQLRQTGINAPRAQKHDDVTVGAALPFMWIGALYLVMSRVDLILLGALKGASAAGIYAIAARAAEFVPFFLTAVNTAMGPKISHLFHAGDHEKLQRLTTASARRLMWITLPFALLLIVLAHPLIRFFYGDRFVDGATALQILAAAQFFTIASGPVGIILNMTRHAGVSAKAFALGALLNILLNVLLIPRFGYTGAATATAISIVFCNGLRWYWVRRHLGIRPSAFGV